MKVEIFRIDPSDTASFSRLLTVFAEVFGMTGFQPPPEEHIAAVLQKESFFSFAATVSDAVVGGITCYVLSPYYSTSQKL